LITAVRNSIALSQVKKQLKDCNTIVLFLRRETSGPHSVYVACVKEPIRKSQFCDHWCTQCFFNIIATM